MKSETKRFLFLAIVFSAVTILFALLYHFRVISNMDLYLAVTYTCYFVGIALFYNGAYTRNKDKTNATKLNFLFGVIFTLVAIALLTIGLVRGDIVMF